VLRVSAFPLLWLRLVQVCACFPYIPVPAAVAAAAAQQYQQQQKTENADEAVPRPRGRPRKHPLISVATGHPAVAQPVQDVRFWWQDVSSCGMKHEDPSD